MEVVTTMDRDEGDHGDHGVGMMCSLHGAWSGGQKNKNENENNQQYKRWCYTKAGGATGRSVRQYD